MSPTATRTDAVRRLLLAVPNRRTIFEAIVAHPGIHARALARTLDIGASVVSHHVRQLERHGLIFSHHEGRRTSLFAVGQVDPDDAAAAHLLRKPVCADLLLALVEQGECSVARLAEYVGCPPTTASHHLCHMHDHGLVDRLRVGRENFYMLQDPEQADRLIGALSLDRRTPRPDACFVGLLSRAPPPGEAIPLARLAD